jgi:redox-sensitive bicupin YhaK (pirin superfamily)
MIQIHKASARGQADYGWLKANYAFSFAEYFDPQRMGLGSLRVLNEDFISAGGGFPNHGHRDMEILTYIIEGTLEHIDSMGNRSVIEAGEFQMMSAGMGVTHSEANASQTEPVHLFQIWIKPSERSLQPGYKQMRFEGIHNELRQVAGRAGDAHPNDVLAIHQDAKIYSAQLDAEETLTYRVDPSRSVWIQVAKGAMVLNGERIEQGDGVEVLGAAELTFAAQADSEYLLFDLA